MEEGRDLYAPVVMSAEEFRTMCAVGLAADAVGVFAGGPLCVVELDGGADLAPLSPLLPCVVIGIAPAGTAPQNPPGLDILLTDVPEAPFPWVSCHDVPSVLDGLRVACQAAPLAAISLAQLLRFTPQLPVAEALVAESFVYSMLQGGATHRSWLAQRTERRPAPAEDDPVAVGRHGDVLSICLNRPRVHNAYNAAMRDGLASALQVASADPTVRVVRICGIGPSFCSGGDLQEFGTAPDPATAHAVRTTKGAAIWMAECAERTTVNVHGASIGAGIELASFAGHVVSSPDAFFQLPEVAMGLVPGAGGTVSIPRRIGRQRTAFLAISGIRLDAQTALTWGLVDEVAAQSPCESHGTNHRSI
jgi:enoyl-CoA hydratase/carnithine racemase